MDKIKSYIKIARPDHWIKQLFILPGIWLAAVLTDTQPGIFRILVCLLATSFAASANYVINEWLDAEFDRFHPTKKNRPCVSEELKSGYVYTEYIILVILSVLTSLYLNRPVTYFILLLLVMGIVYNVKPLRTKDIPYLDVITESVNNAIRFAIGWFCVTGDYYPPLSFITGYWLTGAFLMAAKRFAEYRMINDPAQATLYRKSFGGYTEVTLLLSAVFYALMSVFFCGVFLIKYKIELLLAIPFICGLFICYLQLCYKHDSAAQKPEKLFHEKGLMLYLLLLALLFVALYYSNIPFLNAFLGTDLVRI